MAPGRGINNIYRLRDYTFATCFRPCNSYAKSHQSSAAQLFASQRFNCKHTKCKLASASQSQSLIQRHRPRECRTGYFGLRCAECHQRDKATRPSVEVGRRPQFA
eukprot:4245148-Pleurochrysis_carterae.AAC.1